MKTSYYFHFKIASHRARIASHSDWVPAIIYIIGIVNYVIFLNYCTGQKVVHILTNANKIWTGSWKGIRRDSSVISISANHSTICLGLEPIRALP